MMRQSIGKKILFYFIFFIQWVIVDEIHLMNDCWLIQTSRPAPRHVVAPANVLRHNTWPILVRLLHRPTKQRAPPSGADWFPICRHHLCPSDGPILWVSPFVKGRWRAGEELKITDENRSGKHRFYLKLDVDKSDDCWQTITVLNARQAVFGYNLEYFRCAQRYQM
jgi:hypothetical protein